MWRLDKIENEEKLSEKIDKLNLSIDNNVKLYLTKLQNEENWNEFSISNIKENIEKNIYNKNSGIYYLEINFEDKLKEYTNKKKLIDYVAKEWEEGSKDNVPKINKKRMHSRKKECYKNGEWTPFYLGKSKRLSERLKEHFTGNGKGEGTYKLNLEHNESEVFKNSKYRVKVIEIEELQDDKYYWVLTRIESELREKLNPICGKQ